MQNFGEQTFVVEGAEKLQLSGGEVNGERSLIFLPFHVQNVLQRGYKILFVP